MSLRTSYRRALCVGALVLAAACGDSPTGGGTGTPPVQPPTSTAPAITAAAITASGAGVLTGTNLDQLPTTVIVDGRSITATSRTATEIRFVLPALRECETDGRPVSIAVGALTFTAPLNAPGAVEMAAGESRVLSDTDLSCLRLPAADQDYVLTVLNPVIRYLDGDTLHHFLSFRTGPDAAVNASETPSLQRSADAAALARHLALEAAVLPSIAGEFGSDPVPFDPTYPTAQVGETVRFVDGVQLEKISDRCSIPKSEVPTYPAEIAVISGDLVVAVDLRLANAAEYLSPAGKKHLQVAADIAGPVLDRVFRDIFDPEYRDLQGAGGRRYAVIAYPWAQAAAIGGDGITNLPTRWCRHSSEMSATFYFASSFPTSGDPRFLASVMVHEFGHTATAITAWRNPNHTMGTGFLTEPWAMVSQELAARITSNQEWDAGFAKLGPIDPYDRTYMAGFWAGNGSPLQGKSPWGRFAGYTVGPGLLMYARESAGTPPFRRVPAAELCFSGSTPAGTTGGRRSPR